MQWHLLIPNPMVVRGRAAPTVWMATWPSVALSCWRREILSKSSSHLDKLPRLNLLHPTFWVAPPLLGIEWFPLILALGRGANAASVHVAVSKRELGSALHDWTEVVGKWELLPKQLKAYKWGLSNKINGGLIGHGSDCDRCQHVGWWQLSKTVVHYVGWEGQW